MAFAVAVVVFVALVTAGVTVLARAVSGLALDRNRWRQAAMLARQEADTTEACRRRAAQRYDDLVADLARGWPVVLYTADAVVTAWPQLEPYAEVVSQASDAAPGEGAGVSSRTGRGV